MNQLKLKCINKFMLIVWWDYKDILCFELLLKNKRINLNVYCNHLDKLYSTIQEKRPELVNCYDVVFQHNNARPKIIDV